MEMTNCRPLEGMKRYQSNYSWDSALRDVKKGKKPWRTDDMRQTMRPVLGMGFGG
jgi:hypothetical protein